MPSDEAPDDDEVRQSYNFAPGYHGLVYRADVPDSGAGSARAHHAKQGGDSIEQAAQKADEHAGEKESRDTRYKLQAMQWGMQLKWRNHAIYRS